jgi:mediator of RNA polymerase II transcription subunit 17, fungi type
MDLHFRYTLRLTFVSPSTLTVHLSQADLAVPSIPQLSQLLSSEIERCLLRRICEIGNKLCEKVNGVWFVDEIKGQSIGRWEGCVL